MALSATAAPPIFHFSKFQANGKGMVGMDDDLLLHLAGTLYDGRLAGQRIRGQKDRLPWVIVGNADSEMTDPKRSPYITSVLLAGSPLIKINILT